MLYILSLSEFRGQIVHSCPVFRWLECTLCSCLQNHSWESRLCCAVEVLASPLPLHPYELVLCLPVADAQCTSLSSLNQEGLLLLNVPTILPVDTKRRSEDTMFLSWLHLWQLQGLCWHCWRSLSLSPQTHISRLPPGAVAGQSVAIEGGVCRLESPVNWLRAECEVSERHFKTWALDYLIELGCFIFLVL